MTYLFGLNHDAYCARKYVNEQFGICKEVITPRNVAGDIYSGFKEPKVSYYMGNDGQIYDSAQELYEGEFLTPWFDYATHKPVRDGYYETDCGMAFWYGNVLKVVNQQKAPTKWRGMVDVPERKPA
jgi:hypothetical protein